MKKGDATRARMIDAASEAFEREGFSGAGLAGILEASGAPRGSLYFHFPGGKEELAVASIEASSTRLALELASVLVDARSPEAGLAAVVRHLADRLEESGFEKGCPISSIVASSSAAPTVVREGVADALVNLEARLADYLIAHGRTQADARARATVVLAAIEGALLLARVRRSRAPLARIEAAIPSLLA